MAGIHHRRERIRQEIDQPGLRASIAADLNVVTSVSGGSANAEQRVVIKQRRGDTSPPPSTSEEKS